MSETVIRKRFVASGADLKREYAAMYAERSDGIGVIRHMAHADGYVMVRRPGSMPFVMPEKKWRNFASPPSNDDGTKTQSQPEPNFGLRKGEE